MSCHAEEARMLQEGNMCLLVPQAASTSSGPAMCWKVMHRMSRSPSMQQWQEIDAGT